jgi:predicted ester cyclase
MSIDENKKLVRRFCEEVLDQGNLDRIDELVAPDTSLFGLDELEDFKRELPKNRAALSDVSFDIEDMFAEGDKVCVRGTFRAIHDRGEWLGMTPTGNRVTETVIDIYRVKEGKIVEVWSEDSGPKQAEESPST